MTAFGAVSLDAMGTLVTIEPPGPRLQHSLERRLGRVVDLADCEGAMRVEMRHYRAHCISARNAQSLAALRLECASLLADALAIDVSGPDLLPSLTDAISFRAFPEAGAALGRLAGAGLRLAVIANWDVSLHEVLARFGLDEHLAAIVTAAEVGASKPDPRPFAIALERLGVEAAGCVHVGDDPVTDVEGARAAGLTAILLDRSGGTDGALSDLSQLPARVGVAG